MVLARAFAALAALAIALTTLRARAEPHFAQREGYRCGVCHVNRTGGGKRTLFGYQYGLTHLDAFAVGPSRDAAPAAAAGPLSAAYAVLDPQLGDAVSVGAELRAANTTAFAEEIHNAFEMPEADLYLAVDATRWLRLYVDTSIAEGGVEGREAFAQVGFAPGFALKAGYFLLPFGLRVWDDEAFTRRQTGYTFATPDLGVELGLERGPFGIFTAVSSGAGSGADPDVFKKLSVWSEVAHKPVRVGLSGSYNRAEDRTFYAGGPLAGFTLGRLVIMGEADLLATRYLDAGANVLSLVGFAEANLLVRRGLNLKLSYGYHDPDLEQAEDGRVAIRAGVELAPMPLLLTGLYYRLGLSVPQDEIGNADRLSAELHLYF